MNEMDKINNRLSSVMNWLRNGKENESIRAELYSAAAKMCREIAESIEALEKTE